MHRSPTGEKKGESFDVSGFVRMHFLLCYKEFT